ncbi:MAG: GerMN domain-containing protein [Clostridia bacterium]|nr:GerMN domain-containing protein [Clostridia bacterium]
MVKRSICVLYFLMLLFVLSGCQSALKASEPMAELPEIRAGTTSPLADEQVDEELFVQLCFLSESEDSFSRVTRMITVPGGMSREQVVLDELLNGPTDAERGTWPEIQGTTKGEVETAGAYCTVNLPARFRRLEPEQLYAVRAAVAETLLSLPDINYVSVLIGGREEGVDLAGTIPAGTFVRSTQQRISAAYANFEEIRTAGIGFTEPVMLYIPDLLGKYMVPLVRDVVFETNTNIEYVNKLLEELGREEQGHLPVPPPLDYLEEMPEIVKGETGENRMITLHFTKNLEAALDTAGISMGLYIAMLDDTLMSFVPGIDGMEVTVSGRRIEWIPANETPNKEEIIFPDGRITRQMVRSYLGAETVGYTKGESRLKHFTLVIPAAENRNVRATLGALLDSEEGKSLFQNDVDAGDILAVRTERNRIVINLSRRFYERLNGMSTEEMRLSLYAVINTVTENRSADQVVLFFGGTQMQGDGAVDLRGNFMRATGLIEE